MSTSSEIHRSPKSDDSILFTISEEGQEDDYVRRTSEEHVSIEGEGSREMESSSSLSFSMTDTEEDRANSPHDDFHRVHRGSMLESLDSSSDMEGHENQEQDQEEEQEDDTLLESDVTVFRFDDDYLARDRTDDDIEEQVNGGSQEGEGGETVHYSSWSTDNVPCMLGKSVTTLPRHLGTETRRGARSSHTVRLLEDKRTPTCGTTVMGPRISPSIPSGCNQQQDSACDPPHGWQAPRIDDGAEDIRGVSLWLTQPNCWFTTGEGDTDPNCEGDTDPNCEGDTDPNTQDLEDADSNFHLTGTREIDGDTNMIDVTFGSGNDIMLKLKVDIAVCFPITPCLGHYVATDRGRYRLRLVDTWSRDQFLAHASIVVRVAAHGMVEKLECDLQTYKPQYRTMRMEDNNTRRRNPKEWTGMGRFSHQIVVPISNYDPEDVGDYHTARLEEAVLIDAFLKCDDEMPIYLGNTSVQIPRPHMIGKITRKGTMTTKEELVRCDRKRLDLSGLTAREGTKCQMPEGLLPRSRIRVQQTASYMVKSLILCRRRRE